MVQVDAFWAVVGPVWNQLVDVFKKAWEQLHRLAIPLNLPLVTSAAKATPWRPLVNSWATSSKAILNVVGVLVEALVPVIKWVFPLVVDYVKGVIEKVHESLTKHDSVYFQWQTANRFDELVE
jgi:phage-related protein